jgi:hypothetical protein
VYGIYRLGKHTHAAESINSQTVAEAGEAGRGPGPYKEIFPNFSFCKIFKILISLKYFF